MEDDKPKGHKVNEKLKKRRDKKKEHKKQKKHKHEAYDREEQREKYFEQEKHKKIKKQDKKKQKDSYGIKVYKLKAVMEKFTKVYKDDLDEFYGIWKELDEGRAIDFENLEDQLIKKYLKKICKYLNLKKTGSEYRKPLSSEVNLESYVTKKMEEVMEDYIENGTGSEGSDDESEQSGAEHGQGGEKKKKKGMETVQQKQDNQGQEGQEEEGWYEEQDEKFNDHNLNFKRLAELRENLDKPSDDEGEQRREQKDDGNSNRVMMGPMIPPEQREMLQKMFEQTVKTFEQEKTEQQLEEQAIDKMYGYKPQIKIQQKVIRSPYEMTPEEASRLMYRYSKAYRNRTLIQQYKERMIKLGKFKPGGVSKKPDNKRGARGGYGQQQSYQRDPADLARIEAKRIDDMAKNSMFFSFKDRMSKPSVSNSFL